jgi:hypothetical protein
MTQPNYPDRFSRSYLNDNFNPHPDRQTAFSTLLVGIFISAAIASSMAALYLFNLVPRSVPRSAPNTATSLSQS